MPRPRLPRPRPRPLFPVLKARPRPNIPVMMMMMMMMMVMIFQHVNHVFVIGTGLLRVVKQQVQIPVHVMIRPRAGDFHYSDQEMDVMRTDVRILKENGADGFVLGLLHRSLLHFHYFHAQILINAEVSARTGLPPVMDFIRRRRLSVFGHIARLAQRTPVHNALHC